MTKIPRLLPLIAIAIGGVVAVRAVGAGPGLFEGAKAWAEEAASAVSPAAGAQPARTPPPVCALTPDQLAQQAGISPAELRIIQSLSTRRKELDARDTSFETTLPLMVAAEQKLDAKLQALTAIKAEVQGLLGQVDAKAKAENDRLVAVYSAMRPRDAANIFNALSDDVRLPVAAAMRPRGLAAVLAQMPPAKAQELTEKLARRYQAQQLAARAAAASAVEAAASANTSPGQTPGAPSSAVQPAGPAAVAQGTAAQAAAGPGAAGSRATGSGTTGAGAATAAQPSAPTRAAARPASTPARARPRPATRAATRPAARAAAPAATAAAGAQPYAPGAASPTAATPRQSVQ